MLTKEENDFLTRVGPGTPAGELFRRYWLPFYVAKELTAESPTKFIRLHWAIPTIRGASGVSACDLRCSMGLRRRGR